MNGDKKYLWASDGQLHDEPEPGGFDYQKAQEKGYIEKAPEYPWEKKPK